MDAKVRLSALVLATSSQLATTTKVRLMGFTYLEGKTALFWSKEQFFLKKKAPSARAVWVFQLAECGLLEPLYAQFMTGLRSSYRP